jgi:hypothetical protein
LIPGVFQELIHSDELMSVFAVAAGVPAADPETTISPCSHILKYDLGLVSERIQLVFRRYEYVAALHRGKILSNVIPHFVDVAFNTQAQQVHHADEFKVYRVSLVVPVIVLSLFALPLSFGEG